MKIQLIILLSAITLLGSCHSKTPQTVSAEETKICTSDSTKACCTKAEQKACCTQTVSTAQEGVQVLYFHNERRCATCMAVEEGAAEVVKQFADSAIVFNSYLIGDPLTAQIEKDLNIDGQTLLIVSKGNVKNLTNVAFLNARVKPETYKEALKTAIDEMK